METQNKNTPKWIRDLIPQSWNPELLISGIAIIALLKIPDVIPDAIRGMHYYIDNREGSLVISLIFAVLQKMLISASYALLINFVIHLVLRGFWIGVLGLYSAFPDGIDYGKMNFTPRFVNRYKKRLIDFDKLIIKLDSICSTIYSLGFMVFLMLVGLSIAISFNLIIVEVLLNVSDSGTANANNIHFSVMGNGTTFMIILLLGFLLWLPALFYFIDFITLGLLKKVKWIYKLYFPAYWFYSILTLAPLYRPIYYNFYTNLSKRKLFLILIVYLFSFYLASVINQKYGIEEKSELLLSSNIVNDNSYENLRNDKWERPDVILHSDIIDENYIKIYIKKEPFYVLQGALKGLEISSDSLKINEIDNSFFDKMNHIYVNDTLVEEYSFFNSKPSLLMERTMVTYINTNHTRKGINYLKIERCYSDDFDEINPTVTKKIIIPFYVP